VASLSLADGPRGPQTVRAFDEKSSMLALGLQSQECTLEAVHQCGSRWAVGAQLPTLHGGQYLSEQPLGLPDLCVLHPTDGATLDSATHIL